MSHLAVTILSLSQDMDLASGSMANFMMVRLPNGKVVRALIGDEAAQDIVSLSVVNGATIPAPPPQEEAEDPDFTSQVLSTHVFGGDGAADDGAPAPEPESPPPAPLPAPAARAVIRPRRVDKDEMGYPVVHADGAVDPRDATGGRDRDEDGVGQI